MFSKFFAALRRTPAAPTPDARVHLIRIVVALPADCARALARLPPANRPARLIAIWSRDPLSGRLQCRWQTMSATGIEEEPPPAGFDRDAFARAIPARAAADSAAGAVPSGRIEVRHEVLPPSPFAVPARRRARTRPRVAQRL